MVSVFICHNCYFCQIYASLYCVSVNGINSHSIQPGRLLCYVMFELIYISNTGVLIERVFVVHLFHWHIL